MATTIRESPGIVSMVALNTAVKRPADRSGANASIPDNRLNTFPTSLGSIILVKWSANTN